MLYDAEAKRVANHVCERQATTLRGVMLSEDGQATIVFGNDDYAGNDCTRDLVRALMQAAHEADCQVLGFATSDCEERRGRAWALVVRCDDLDWARARLHEAFFESHPAPAASHDGTAGDSANSSPASAPRKERHSKPLPMPTLLRDVGMAPSRKLKD